MYEERLPLSECDLKEKENIMVKGDCTTCVYNNCTDNTLPCYEFVYGGVCKLVKGDRGEMFQILPQHIKYGVDATPDREYPLRILRAYLDDFLVHTHPEEDLGDFLNELQRQRNEILEKAIRLIEEHWEDKE